MDFGISADIPCRISPFCPSLFIRFIIVDMSSNCFSNLLTSCTLVPAPAALRADATPEEPDQRHRHGTEYAPCDPVGQQRGGPGQRDQREQERI